MPPSLPLPLTATLPPILPYPPARSMDVESGPDADTPRPIGVGLLLCMLERGGDDVVIALIRLAQTMQVWIGWWECGHVLVRCGRGVNS